MRPGRRVTAGQVIGGITLVAVIFAAGAVTIALTPSPRAGTGSAGRAGEGQPGGGQPDGSGGAIGTGQAGGGQAGSQGGTGRGGAAQGGGVVAAAAVRLQSARWVASEVGPGSIVGCDPAMCAALQGAGVTAARLLILRAGQADPLGCDVLVATAAVRSMFGARLAGVYAPVALAVFGRGPAAVSVRAVAPDGAAAYVSALAADTSARRAAGSQLTRNPHVHASAAATGPLTAGRVDSRLLVVLATLAGLHPLDILSFGGPPPGASVGVPLRSAVIAPARPPGGHPPRVAALRGFLLAQRPPYRPLSVQVTPDAPRPGLLTVTYPAPSPLGLLGPGG